MGILLTQREGLIVGNIAKILGFIMNAIFELLSKIGIENIGLCIIIFTVVVYTLMLPMTIKQQKFTFYFIFLYTICSIIHGKYYPPFIIIIID